MTPGSTTEPRAVWIVGFGLLLIAFTLQSAFRTIALAEETVALRRIAAEQTIALPQNLRAREQLHVLATGIVSLAHDGNPNAAAVLTMMKARGVVLSK